MKPQDPSEVTRALDLPAVLRERSCFLFGPRQTGKSWLIRHTLGQARVYNLLDTDTYLSLSRAPRRLREECQENECVVIDEIQKLPNLLDEVHLLMEERGIRFLLTGSSARKLRHGGVNLLGGRARGRHLHPLSFCELGERFDLLRAINCGLLPAHYFLASPEDDLQSYVGTYLKEEIAAEGLTRNVPAFSRFLEVAGLCHGRMINFTKIANDAQVPRSTIQEYFGILKDTLLGYDLPAWQASKKRKPISTSKWYFFDGGVAKHLQHRGEIKPGSPEFGEGFETLIFHELKTYCDYRNAGDLAYWRSTSGYEVDFILSHTTAVEVKASRTVAPQDLRGLRALKEEKQLKHYVLVSLEERPRVVEGIYLLPWREFLSQLWAGAFSS